MDYPKVAQKSPDDRTPFPVPGNARPREFPRFAAEALAEEVAELSRRVNGMVARMAQYRIAVLPEVTRLDKRIDGAADLKAFIDVLEDTLNWEIRMNVDVAEEGPKDGVSDVSDPPNGRP